MPRTPQAMFTLKVILACLFQVVLFSVLLLVPAETFWWGRAWVFMAIMFVIGVVSSLRLPREIVEQRLKPPMHAGQPLADKFVSVLFVLAFLAATVFIPLDVFRFHLLGEPSPIIATVGLTLVVASCWIMYRAMQQNTFAIPVVRLQEERHQRVIDSGPYAIVRHPLYAGGLLLFVGTPLWLGSYAGMLAALAPIAALMIRIRIEERLLFAELRGYAAYAERVRYRLIPSVW